MKKTWAMTAIVVSITACAGDVTASEEYQALEQEMAAIEQQLSDTTAELTEVRADFEAVEASGPSEIPAEVLELIDEWWAANMRADGSVAELYLPTGYHLYGTERISLGDLASHLSRPGWEHEWISEPYLIAAEPDGRYLVTRGMRNTYGPASVASALTFEILTTADGELRIADTGWKKGHLDPQ